jgi:spore germination protein GerM
MRVRAGRSRFSVSAAFVLAALGVAGCSAPVDSGPKTLRAASIPANLRAETSSTTSTTVLSGASEEVTVYFIGPDERLVPVKHRVSSPVSLEKVLQNLFAGPTPAEAVGGLRTAISPETTILGAPIEARIATVNVSRNFAFGRVSDHPIAFAQVVFTAVDVEGVTGVLFAVNGRRQEAPEGDGRVTSTPLGRASYAQVTPR